MQQPDAYQLYWLFLYYPVFMLVFGLLCRGTWANKKSGTAAAIPDQNKSESKKSDDLLSVQTKELLSKPPVEVSDLNASTVFGIMMMAFYHLQAALAVRYARQNAHTKMLTIIMLCFSTFLVATELIELMLQIMRTKVEKDKQRPSDDNDKNTRTDNEDVELIEKEDARQDQIKVDGQHTGNSTHAILQLGDGPGILNWLHKGMGLMLGSMLVPWVRTFMA